MARYAVIDQGTVINVVEWDGQATWSPPAGLIAVPSDSAKIRDSYTGGIYTSHIELPPLLTRREELRLKAHTGSLTPPEVQEAL